MAADYTGIPGTRVGTRVEEVCRHLNWEWAKITAAVYVIFIPTWWKYNPPENPSVLHGNLDDLDGVPHSPLVASFCENVTYLKQSLHETLRTRVGTRVGTRGPHQEQEQEQEKNGSSGADAPGASAPPLEQQQPSGPQPREDQPKQGRKRSPLPASPGHPAIALYCDHWKARYGKNPDISPKDAGILARLAKKADLEEYGRRLERYLRDGEPFLVKQAHPPAQFESRWNALGVQTAATVAGSNVVPMKTPAEMAIMRAAQYS
jgi:hypothetical protein